jgi:hypothetical protein
MSEKVKRKCREVTIIAGFSLRDSIVNPEDAIARETASISS